MTEVNESTPWQQEFSSVVDDKDVGRYGNSYSGSAVDGCGSPEVEVEVGWRYQVVEFAKGVAEMSVEFGKGVRDVVRQSVIREDSVIVKRVKGPCEMIFGKLRFLNEYLPEDRDPVHAWSVIICVWVIALAALVMNIDYGATTPVINKMKIHPPSASLILLPDGRSLAYQEQGVPAHQARFSMIIPHSFLSSRLSGIPGIKPSLLQDFGVRVVTYDLPGFGESDPHPGRNLESSAMDMLHLSYAVNVTDKFWVLGYSGGSMHAWAALRYIPDRVAGALMISPMVNPYEPRMTKDERRKIWKKWTTKKKLMYLLARKFPRLLPRFYRRSFLSGKHGQLETYLSLSLGKRDRALVEDKMFEEFWQRDVEESVRQENVKPFVEEAVLQVSNWDFSLADLQVRKKLQGKNLLEWIKSIYSQDEESLSGFLGPIHIWHGTEDKVAPPSMSDFVQRILPDAMLHKLLHEGHFTYFYFCDQCHHQIFTTVFGDPEGPLPPKAEETQTPVQDEDNTEVLFDEIAADNQNVSSLPSTPET